jgi:hypothetical protein
VTPNDPVIGLLADANPVSDPNTFALSMVAATRHKTIEQGTKTMTETELRSIEPPTTGRNRRGWLVAAAAAALILIVGIGTGIVVGQNLDESPADSPATTPAASMTPAETIEGYAAAYSAGDIDPVMAFFVEESVVTGHPSGSTLSKIVGLAAIRDIHSEVGEGVTYTILITDVAGNTVTWNHIWSGFENGEPFRTCQNGHTAVINDGKIMTWQWPASPIGCE